ncbi:MAG: sulfotransferase, partial [Phycisphaerae bacterium]|nr:sulfotransferase [Phycisphaerae bacterium]
VDMRSFTWFEIAKVRDRGGDYDGAWAAATEAHRLAGKRFDVGGYEELLASIRRVFDRKHLQQWAHATQPDPHQVFIVGMPRSGTTLLEQILSMHPDVANAGELAVSTSMQRRMSTLMDTFLAWPNSIADMQERDADVLQQMYQASVAELGNGKQRVTNKALVLQHHMGLLSLVLPGSHSIMLHRHPLDNMVSCYTTDLVGSGHHYCSDVETLAKVWVARRQMQDFWFENLEKQPLELHYEQLVDDQEAQTRRLLAHLDLPWNDACLAFHKSKRKVATISFDQVTRKMYGTSKGRWQHYERHLGPAIKLVERFL